MASKTTSQWYDWLLNEKANVSELDAYTSGPANASSLFAALTNKSKVAMWALWLWLVAVTARALEDLFDTHKAEVQALAEAAIAGNDAWLRNQVLLFETNNTTLTVSPNRTAVYASSNVDNRVVKFCAIVAQRGKAIVKVAGADVNGQPVKLSDAVMVQLNTYLDRIRFAGTQVAAMSKDADEMAISGTIYYNGVASVTDVQDAVKQAIKDYLGSLPFNGAVSLEKLTDAIQAVPNVSDLKVAFAFREAGVGDYALDPSAYAYLSVSGFVLLDEGTFGDLNWQAV